MLEVKTPKEVLRLIEKEIKPLGRTETVPLAQAPGRVLAEAITAKEYVPDFDRSTVDGYACRAADTFGCSDAIPAILSVAGQVLMGESADFALSRGSCVYVPTGGAIPRGAWKSSTVVLGSSTEMVYKFEASDITGLQIKIEVDGVQKMMIDASDLTIEGGRYVVSVNCVSAVQYGSEVKATFVINGVESDSVAYSINGFLYNNLAKNEGTALGDLMKALYVYGDTTYKHFYNN